ncbi:hypothetical protein GGR53DRAFT_464429 [Hypoxylon sp. FL1150]|nr:hypothetical protein GGR53DRAFT_464429 [Hypoxylon sp. FL1150]
MAPRKDKDRLYIILYARGAEAKMPGGEDKYHWGLAIGPKIGPGLDAETEGTLFHTKERRDDASRWEFEERPIRAGHSGAMLVRVVVGKITDIYQLQTLLREVSVRPADPDWNCVIWVKEALERLVGDGRALGTSVDDWDAAREEAMWYVEKKKAEHRFDGEAHRLYDMRKVATWDMLDGKELIP